jgi:hypothetical protein
VGVGVWQHQAAIACFDYLQSAAFSEKSTLYLYVAQDLHHGVHCLFAFLLHPHYDFAFGASLGQVLKGLLRLVERKHFVYNRMDMTGVKKRANFVQLLAVRSHE